MDHFISMYIDDELSLDEKILFLKHVHGNRAYTVEAAALLSQEKELVSLMNKPAPEITLPLTKGVRIQRMFGLAAAACLLMVLSFFTGATLTGFQGVSEPLAIEPNLNVPHRFVIHQRDSQQVEIAGSFTNWQRVSMIPTGVDGYWEISLRVPFGEHRYSFIVDGRKRIPDPTVAAQESDDFGTINSIINVETEA